MPPFIPLYLWTLALGKVFDMEAPLPGYSVEILQWEVPVSLEGRTVTLNGTVQQVYDQLLQINPKHGAEFGAIDNTFGVVDNKNAAALVETWRKIGAMERQHDALSDCGHWDPARAEAIWEGINHLNVHLPKNSFLGDNEKSLSSYHEIASSVQSLTMNCTYWSDNHLEPQVSAQQFHADKWITIVKGAIC